MKILISMFILVCSIHGFSSEPNEQIIAVNEDVFSRMSYASPSFRGKISAVLSDKINGIDGFVRPKVSRNNNKRVLINTNGNRHIVGKYLLPIRANIVFELKDGEGNFVSYETEFGEEITFEPYPLVFYLIETDIDYERRLGDVRSFNQKSKKLTLPENTGRFVGVGRFQYNKIFDIEFYEMVESEGAILLKEAGAFSKNIY